MSQTDSKLVLVSNRGPATFARDEAGKLTATRGGGGLVTALTGLVHHRDALSLASAMSQVEIEMAGSYGGYGLAVDLDGVTYRVRLVVSGQGAYDRFYIVVANHRLWFIQHYQCDH